MVRGKYFRTKRICAIKSFENSPPTIKNRNPLRITDKTASYPAPFLPINENKATKSILYALYFQRLRNFCYQIIWLR